jgi:phosphotriesterase-related protein
MAMTVLGPVPAEALGVTLAHEHLLIDLSCLRADAIFPWQRGLRDGEPTLETRGLLSLDPYVNASNLVLDDVDLAAAELEQFRELGGGCVVDLTVRGIAPQPGALAEISRRTGLHVVAGCGWYVQRSHPEEVARMSVAQLAEDLLAEIAEGSGDTGVRPGIIGELGTSSPIHADEIKVLQAGSRAQRETGLAINVHVPIFAREALNVLRVLESAGANLSRVVISHLDEMLELEYHLAVLATGAYVEFDTFGSECYFESRKRRESSDAERLEALLRLLDAGWAERLLLSQDVCTKLHLRRYGGYGYGHVLRSIVPRLRERGVDADVIETLLIRNPARLLS